MATKLEILIIRADLIANGHHMMRDNTNSFPGSFSCFALSLQTANVNSCTLRHGCKLG